MYEIKGGWEKGFLRIRAKVSGEVYCPALEVELVYSDGHSEFIHFPITKRGLSNNIALAKEKVDLARVNVCNGSSLEYVKVDSLSKIEAIYTMYRRVVPFLFGPGDTKKNRRLYLSLNFLDVLLKPYASYRAVTNFILLRNKGHLTFEEYESFLKKFIRKQEEKIDLTAVICLEERGEPKDTIKTLTDSGIAQILLCKKGSQELLDKVVGEYVMLIKEGDWVRGYLLDTVCAFLKKRRPEVVYFDHTTDSGHFFKPDWSFYYYIHHDYISRAVLFRRDTFFETIRGGFVCEDGFHYNALLNLFMKRNIKPAHIPVPLFHLKEEESPHGEMFRLEAVKSIFGDRVVKDTKRNVFVYIPEIKEAQVSIIIPTKDKSELLSKCVYSIFEKTSYKNYKLVIVDNNSREDNTFEMYRKLESEERIKIIEYPHPYNFSKIVNFAMKYVEDDYVVLLNNDTEIISEDWLEWIVRYLSLEDVGVVGGKLLYPNGKVQHGGVIVGLMGLADHAFKWVDGESDGYMMRLSIPQEYLAVTAACMGFRKEVFLKVGGFEEALVVNFNDLDFCLKVYEAGYKILYLPQVRLIHHEHATRGKDDTKEKMKRTEAEKEYILKKWSKYVEYDPYYNPNLTNYRNDFSLWLPKPHRLV